MFNPDLLITWIKSSTTCALGAALLLFGLASTNTAAETLRGFTVSSDISDTDLEALETWNANVLRFHLGTSRDLSHITQTEFLAWLDEALIRLDQVVEWGRRTNHKIVIDLHSPPGSFTRSDRPVLHKLFVDSEMRETFFAAWRVIAARYRGDEVIWGFDLLNEPALPRGSRGTFPLDALMKRAAQEINVIDPTRKIIVEPAYGDIARLSTVKTLSFPTMVLSVHYYYPLKFVHQGLYGAPINVVYPTKKLNRQALLKYLRPLISFTAKTKRQVYIGEFTAPRWAPRNGAFRYLRDLIPLFERPGWHWTYHSFREADVWNLELTTAPDSRERALGLSDRERLIRSYFARNAQKQP